MGNVVRALAPCLVLMLVPAPAVAWGFTGHRLIMSRAIDLLPPELKPFFTTHRDEIVIRVVDPDHWRNVGWAEDPHHFLDFGVREYGEYPFTELPREYDAALQKFGRATLERNGLLPWREAEMFGNLTRAFAAFPRQAPYTVTDTVLFSAVLAHYAGDCYQPFHATDDYDGARTGQRGIHARFERDLIERFGSRLVLQPAAPTPIAAPRDAAFDALIASHQLVDDILAADKEAAAEKATYDDDYFERFFVRIQPVLQRQLSQAVTATAGLIIGAWEAAGRPALRLRDARPLEKVGR